MTITSDPSLKEIVTKITLALLVIMAVVGGCSVVNRKLGLQDDHAIEEAVEDHIKDRVGIDVDLTPGSRET